jgi:hypothetical protein
VNVSKGIGPSLLTTETAKFSYSPEELFKVESPPGTTSYSTIGKLVRCMNRRFLVILVTWTVLHACCPKALFGQAGARTMARSLDQLVEESEVIVHGSVVSAKIEPHPKLRNLKTVLVVMNVKETYKGNARKSLTFRQYVGGDVLQAASGGYRKGQELVLMLRPASDLGLTSPAGLEQGLFRVVADPKHGVTAINGRGNVALFNHLEQTARSRGLRLSDRAVKAVREHDGTRLSLADLQDLIRTFVGTH